MRSPKRAPADEKFMQAALQEAHKGVGRTHPNPAVGAVVVRRGRIIGRGWHKAAGKPHAEIEALRSVKGSAAGTSLYITLEPCSTHGRTPPCTQAIIEAGVARVIYGATDPKRRHAGRADDILTRAGVKVTHGVLAEECAALNTHWNKWIASARPYVIAKAALTLDGRISSHPESRWISNERSRRDAMELRASVQAILVGGETVRTDNPQLTVRGKKIAPQPWRVIWTKSGRLPAKAQVLSDEYKDRTLVMKNCSLSEALCALGKRGIASVLIEGGGTVLGQAFDRGLVDEVRFYLSPLLAGGPTPAVGGRGVAGNEKAIRLDEVRYLKIGDDVRLSARVETT